MLILAAGCRTSLSAHKDAGASGDARTQDAWPDVVPPSDATPALPDASASDPADIPRTPMAFRFDNHTDRTAYVEVDTPVACRVQDAAGWQACNFFFYLGCSLRCADVRDDGQCCVPCLRPPPVLYAIPPGASRSLPWNGDLHSLTTGSCRSCRCQQELPAPSGTFEASARVYADYTCAASDCRTTPDGQLEMASPAGGYTSIAVPFVVPYLGEEVVLDITGLPTTDAGPSPDAPPPDASAGEPVADAPADAGPTSPRDATSEPMPVTLADLAGHTYRISASTSLPDASAGGRSCATSNPGAVYELSFSADGAKVSIVRVDGPEEQILNGSLRQPASPSRLTYTIDNAFAGGELSVRADGSTFIALLVLYGSGVPVLWCIESPMARV
jgi:hypothetical protein